MPASPETMQRVAAHLGKRVRELREARGLTQEKLAELSGVSRNQIQNIEHSRNNSKDPVSNRAGPGNPRLDTIYSLAEVLGVEPVVLIDPDTPLPPPQP